jgi:prephenate dehydrogenase
MAAISVDPVAVVGLGAVGGSVAKALVRVGARVSGYAASVSDRDAARRDGVVVSEGIQECVAGMRTVLIAVPVAAHGAVAALVAAAASTDAVLLHAASLQAPDALAAAGGGSASYPHSLARRLIGTHPLAGSHRAGYDAARADLFAGCVVSIESRADAAVRATAEAMWRAAGAARFEYRTAEEHDGVMTWVSHLPQLASIALADSIASSGIAAAALGPGGRDATRLASSSFETWGGILAGARPGAVAATSALENSVRALRAALESGDFDAVARLWNAARAWRDAADAGVGADVRAAR